MQICDILNRILEMAIMFAFGYRGGTHVATTFLGFSIQARAPGISERDSHVFVKGVSKQRLPNHAVVTWLMRRFCIWSNKIYLASFENC
jgi:hypothetical protein